MDMKKVLGPGLSLESLLTSLILALKYDIW